jgi:ubiquinone/menaquinone biosynthesis C-methylase UbiE
VVDLLPAEQVQGKLAQVFMEWEPVIRIYESRLWRKNPLFALYTGITFDREYRLVSDAANLSEDTFLLDLACGSGIYARPFAHRLRRGWVVGLDRSMPMLTWFRSRAEARGLTNLTLIRGDALHLPFEDGVFHAVNCCGALHLFPDAERALAEVRRVLRPGGGFTAAVLETPSGFVARKIAAAPFRGLGLRSFRPDEFSSLLLHAGFRQTEVLHRKKGRGWLVVSALS